MRNLKSVILSVSVLLAFGCSNSETTPKNPQAPVVESASLKAVDGASAVEAGQQVAFKAKVSVKDSELGTYTLEVRKGTEMIGSATGELSGTDALIENTLDLSVSPVTLEEDFYPEVTLKVTNKDGQYAEKKLSEEENVQIRALEIFDMLYLISDGKQFSMVKTATKGKYRTDGDLTGIGTTFTVASKVTSTGEADPSGKVWEGKTVPDGGEYGLAWIGFDMFTGEVSRMLDLTEVFDYALMADDGAYKVYWSRPLVQDCKVVFTNYPADLKIEGDRFDNVEGNTARYTGGTGNRYEIYYAPEPNWLMIKWQYTDPAAIFITGENCSLPMSPYLEKEPISWFEGPVARYCTSTASMVRTDADNYRQLLYLKENFAFKFYTTTAWNAEISPCTSETPGTLTITPITVNEETGNTEGNFANPGPDFPGEGLYMVYFNSSTYKVRLERYIGSILPGVTEVK